MLYQSHYSILSLKGCQTIIYFAVKFYCSSLTHANAFENHESSNGEEPLLKTPPPSTPPPPPVLGYAVAAAAQQNHVDSAPDSPPASVVSSRMVNHVSSAATTMPNSISRPSSLAGNGTEQTIQSNHFPGKCFIDKRSGMVVIGQKNRRVLLHVIRIFQISCQIQGILCLQHVVLLNINYLLN